MFRLIIAMVRQVEFLYSWLVSVLVDELIDGERNHDPDIVIQAFVLIVILSIFSFYMELFVDVYILISVISLVFCQFFNIAGKKYKQIEEEASNNSLSGIVSLHFHEFTMILFLLVFSNFLPKMGHFIMFWIGPLLGIEVPRLMLDLSLTGIWSVFSFEVEFFDVIDFSLIAISLLYSIHCWYKASRSSCYTNLDN